MSAHRFFPLGIASLTLPCLFTALTAAWVQGDVYWDKSTGNWDDQSKWRSGYPSGAVAHEPTTTDDGIVKGGELTVDSTGEEALEMVLGWGTGNTTIFNMVDGGSLSTVGSIYMGRLATGKAYQTGGSLTVGDGLYVGEDTFNEYGYGEYNLSGGTLTTEHTSINTGAEGLFNHTGGSHVVNNDMAIAPSDYTGEGTYNLSGTGNLQVGGYLSLGASGSTALMNQSGGTNTITESLIFKNNGDAACYHLTGGELDIGAGVNQGLKYGKLVLDGGTLTSGGSVDPRELMVGDKGGTTGSYSWTGMTAAPYHAVVGNEGTGAFTQMSGSIGASVVYVGKATGSEGTFTLQDGASLSGQYEIGYGGKGTLVQSGGSSAASVMYIGREADSDGTYQLSGGQLSGQYMVVGDHGSGDFELSGGQADFTGGSAEVVIGKNVGSSGSMEITGTGELLTGKLIVGYNSGATSTLSQTGGSIDAAVQTQVLYGQYQQTGGTLRMARGTGHAVEVGAYYGTHGPATWLLGDASGTGVVTEQGTEDGADLTVGAGGTIRGWGTVGLSGTLDNSGKIVADGYGTSRDLNLSSLSGVANDLENDGANGWYAVNKGRLLLPTINIATAINASYNWGESQDDTSLDLINSLRMTYSNITGAGTLDISLLAADHDLAPDVSVTGPDLSVIAGFDFNASDDLDFNTVDLTLKYDTAAVQAAGLPPDFTLDDLAVYKTVSTDYGEQWIDITDLPGVSIDLDTDAGTVSMHGVPGFSSFAIGVVPEPAALLPLSLLAWAFIRRVRMRHR